MRSLTCALFGLLEIRRAHGILSPPLPGPVLHGPSVPVSRCVVALSELSQTLSTPPDRQQALDELNMQQMKQQGGLKRLPLQYMREIGDSEDLYPYDEVCHHTSHYMRSKRQWLTTCADIHQRARC